MKNFWLILSFLFLIQPIFPVVEYVANYDYIANVLCINKDKKESKCNGKCHLGKEMAKDFDNTNEDNKTVKAEFNLTLFCQEIETKPLHSFISNRTTNPFFTYSAATHSAYADTPLQPPQV